MARGVTPEDTSRSSSTYRRLDCSLDSNSRTPPYHNEDGATVDNTSSIYKPVSDVITDGNHHPGQLYQTPLWYHRRGGGGDQHGRSMYRYTDSWTHQVEIRKTHGSQIINCVSLKVSLKSMLYGRVQYEQVKKFVSITVILLYNYVNYIHNVNVRK